MIVELIGPSGTGKTTAARGVLSAALEIKPGRRSLAQVSGRVPLPSVWSGVRYLPHVLFALLAAEEQVRRGFRHCERSHRSAVIAFACRYRLHRREHDIYLYDQGLVQALIYMTRHWAPGVQKSQLPPLYDSVISGILPDLVVSLCSRPLVASARTKMSGAIHSDIEEIRRTMDCLSEHVEQLRRHAVPVVSLSSDGDERDVIFGICRAIDGFRGAKERHE